MRAKQSASSDGYPPREVSASLPVPARKQVQHRRMPPAIDHRIAVQFSACLFSNPWCLRFWSNCLVYSVTKTNSGVTDLVGPFNSPALVVMIGGIGAVRN